MKNEIESITDAFSMQPMTIRTSETPQNPSFALYCKEIKLEKTTIMVDGLYKEFDVYRCYGWNGSVMYEYLAHTVNVHYKYVD